MNLNGAKPETIGTVHTQVCLWNREKNVINEVNSVKESYIINVSNRHY